MDKLKSFLNGIRGSSHLLEKAVKNNSLIECVCISANLIDALLRIGIILKTQLINDDTRVNEQYLYEDDPEKIISEKEIYKEALAIGVINQQLKEQLFRLYNQRNKVVHRYIICTLSTNDVSTIAIKYLTMHGHIKEIISELENQQVKAGRTISSSDSSIPVGDIFKWVGDITTNKHLKLKFPNK